MTKVEQENFLKNSKDRSVRTFKGFSKELILKYKNKFDMSFIYYNKPSVTGLNKAKIRELFKEDFFDYELLSHTHKISDIIFENSEWIIENYKKLDYWNFYKYSRSSKEQDKIEEILKNARRERILNEAIYTKSLSHKKMYEYIKNFKYKYIFKDFVELLLDIKPDSKTKELILSAVLDNKECSKNQCISLSYFTRSFVIKNIERFKSFGFSVNEYNLYDFAIDINIGATNEWNNFLLSNENLTILDINDNYTGDFPIDYLEANLDIISKKYLESDFKRYYKKIFIELNALALKDSTFYTALLLKNIPVVKMVEDKWNDQLLQ